MNISVQDIITGLSGIKLGLDKLMKGRKKRVITRENVEKYIPEPIKKRVAPKKSRNIISAKLLSILAIGLGVAGAAAAGLGAAKVVKNRLTKKAVILVGDGGKKSLSQGAQGFNGYLLKYTDMDGLEDMIDTLAGNGFTELVIVPMTVINGYEIDKIKAITVQKREFFDKISYAPALLTSSSDYEHIAKMLISYAKDADEDTAVVYVGKGTTHHANSSYIALNERLRQMGSGNIFVGTASSYPDIDKVESDIEAAHYQNVVLCPLEMTVDEELNDSIAGEENSWYSRLVEDGYNCGCYMKGLCAYKGVRELVVEHTKSAM